jgi:hypothetical protein
VVRDVADRRHRHLELTRDVGDSSVGSALQTRWRLR